MAVQIQLRRGTAAQWTSANPVLASGEVGYETDTNKEKIGDGTTAWSSLPYFGGGSPGGSTTQVQFNSSGSFAGDANLTFSGSTLTSANLIVSNLTVSQAVFSSATKQLVSNPITGTGSVVMNSSPVITSPTLITPALGSPASGNMAATTSIPVANATGTLAVANGGTGLTATPTNGQIDIGNGSGFTRTTLTAGTNVTITNGAGSITIAASGGGGGTPGGGFTTVQYNNSGSFGGTANLTFDGTTLNVAAVNVSTSNLTFTTTGQKIVGDFTNATVSNRTNFITGTANSATGIYALPSGTATAASWQATNNSDPTNASKVLIATNGTTDVQLVSGINGSGTYLPLAIFNGGAGRFVVGTSGQFGIGPTATVSYGTSGQVLTSGGASAAPTWSTVSGGGAVANSTIYLNNLIISSSYTIAIGQGAHSVGPITVATGATLTVASGSRYVIA